MSITLTNDPDSWPGGADNSGNDTVSALNGDDTVDGGAGDDSLDGGVGNDILVGGLGSDTLLGGASGDLIVGGAGADSIAADGSNDTIYTGGAYDTSTGASNSGDNGASDTVDGASGNDVIHAGWNDYVLAGPGDDTVYLPNTGTGTWTTTGGSVSTTVDGSPVTFDVWTDGAGHYVYLTQASDTVLTDPGQPCYLEGTRIRTARGEVAVEALRVGDLVVTAHGRGPALQPVVWVGKRRVDLARHPNRAASEPILIRAGALGGGVPARDLRVSPEHAIAVGGRLVPAGLLVNGSSIVREPWWRAVTWYHVELPEHGLLLAEGAPAESYFDAGNRRMFGNAGIVSLFADFAPAPGGEGRRRYEEAACLPLVRGEGDPELHAIRRALAARAAAAGFAAPATAWEDSGPSALLSHARRTAAGSRAG